MNLISRLGGWVFSMSSRRVALTTLTGVTAGYLTLVAFVNITDFGTNRALVRHVPS